MARREIGKGEFHLFPCNACQPELESAVSISLSVHLFAGMEKYLPLLKNACPCPFSAVAQLV